MVLKSMGSSLYETLAGAMTGAFAGLRPMDLTADNVGELFTDWGLVVLKLVVPVAGTIAAVGVVTGLLQTRLLFSTKPLAPKFERINPVQGFSRIFSLQTLVEQVKGLLKLALVGFIAYREVASLLPTTPQIMEQTVPMAVVTITARVIGGLQRIGFGLLALGVADYGYQWWEFQRSQKMTKQEIKQEHKEQEGNPELKQKQRQRAREMARRRKALKDVPMADVVVTNPTHFAIAIKYKVGEDPAPRVIAKGSDLLAQRIKVIAKQHEVPTVENRPLARTLYATVEVGKTVPPELYQAVAEVLAFVYSMRREQRRRR